VIEVRRVGRGLPQIKDAGGFDKEIRPLLREQSAC
jgi:hypothetical protein